MNKQRMSGFSIIEVMIAIALSVVLMGAVIQVFYANHQTNIQVSGMSRLQENGRFASEYLARKMRMIGYSGCVDSRLAVTQYSSLAPKTAVVDPVTEVPHITAFEATSASGTGTWATTVLPLPQVAPTLASILGAGVAPQPGTDVISIISVNPDASMRVSLTKGSTSGEPADCAKDSSSDLLLAPGAINNIVVGDILVVSDCKTSSVFAVSDVTADGTKTTVRHETSTGKNYTNCLCDMSSRRGDGCDYLGDGVVSKMETATYFIAPSANTNNKGATTLSLWRKAGVNPEELVEGVENLQILYGIDNLPANRPDGLVDTYVTGNNLTGVAANTAEVRTIRFSVTTNSVDSVTSGDTTTAATSAAQLIRRTFTQTVRLRNEVYKK